jgi:SAM-dependent methyltransferase
MKDASPAELRADRAFLGRVVRWLAGEGGTRQFVHVHAGSPFRGAADVARHAAPGARIVCVDHGLLAPQRARHRAGAPGTASTVDAPAGDTGDLLQHAGRVVDLDRPVAVLLLAVLHLIGDHDDPHGLVAHLRDALCPGSYLAISHAGPDAGHGPTRRDLPAIRRFFDGLDLVLPGVVRVDTWRPGRLHPVPNGGFPATYGGIGRTVRRPTLPIPLHRQDTR